MGTPHRADTRKGATHKGVTPRKEAIRHRGATPKVATRNPVTPLLPNPDFNLDMEATENNQDTAGRRTPSARMGKSRVSISPSRLSEGLLFEKCTRS